MADEEKQNPFTVLVCDSGNATQVATGMFTARYKTIDEFELTMDNGKIIKLKPEDITNE